MKSNIAWALLGGGFALLGALVYFSFVMSALPSIPEGGVTLVRWRQWYAPMVRVWDAKVPTVSLLRVLRQPQFHQRKPCSRGNSKVWVMTQ